MKIFEQKNTEFPRPFVAFCQRMSYKARRYTVLTSPLACDIIIRKANTKERHYVPEQKEKRRADRPLSKHIRTKARARPAGSAAHEGRRYRLRLCDGNGTSHCTHKELNATLREELGEFGSVCLTYDPAEQTLKLALTFSYPKGSEEIALVEECYDDCFGDDKPLLPGDVEDLEIVFFEDEPATDFRFICSGITDKNLDSALGRLLSRVMDWLDIVYEAFEEQY